MKTTQVTGASFKALTRGKFQVFANGLKIKHLEEFFDNYFDLKSTIVFFA
jgi:hypothetical protein